MALTVILVFSMILTANNPVFSRQLSAVTTAPQDTFTITAVYPTFDGAAIPFQLNGTAVLAQNRVRLTDAGPVQTGTAWWQRQITLLDEGSFSAYFSFEISLPDSAAGGADGMVFAIQPHSAGEGVAGGGMGYGGIRNSMGIEFDTYYNTQNNVDPDGNHIGLNLDGYMASVITAPAPGNLESGIWYVWVDYDGLSDALEVRMSDVITRPVDTVLTDTVDLAAQFGPDVFVGFTAATVRASIAGGAFGEAQVLIEESTPPQATDSVVAYQGLVHLGASPYSGQGYFKFAVVNPAGDTSYWSNDGTSSAGGEPASAVTLAVNEGLFSVLLGDTTLPGMPQALTAGAFVQPQTYLRVWFSTTPSGAFSQLAPDTRIAAVPYALQAQSSVNADTLDGLHADQLQNDYQNVVVVAKSGGDFTSVQAAIDSISDASAGNPYQVWIAPGVYQEQVVMQPHVHLQGAGQQVTVITSAAASTTTPPTLATLVMAGNTSLRDLTVVNTGAGPHNVALLATASLSTTQRVEIHSINVDALAQGSGSDNYGVFLSGGLTLEARNLTARAENGSSSNHGLYNTNGGVARLRGGSFTGVGASNAFGITNLGSITTLEAESVAALGDHHGLFNGDGAQATLHGGSFTERGYGYDSSGYYMTAGIYNTGSGTTLEAESVTAVGEMGSHTWNNANYGLVNENGAKATLRGGTFSGYGGANASQGIRNDNGTLDAAGITARGDDVGLRMFGDSDVIVTQSMLEGATNSVIGSNTLMISNSRLVGGLVNGPVTCVLVTRGMAVSTDGSTCP